MRILVTGACGFIGSNLVRHALGARPDVAVVSFDKLTYAGNLENLAGLPTEGRHRFVRGDVCEGAALAELLRAERIEAVLHLAAETHVDRSVLGPAVFATTNVAGTQAVLDAARAAGVGRVVVVSTDEVYGSLGPSGRFTEDSPLAPSSPYAASKAGADLLALAAHKTFGLDVVVARSSNNYGPYQLPEKLVPLMIVNALRDLPLPVYGDGLNVRDWLHVEDHCAALLVLLERGRAGEVYNVGGGNERTNLEVVERILALTGKPRALVRFVEDRPGHDRRYALDCSKLARETGFRPRRDFEEGLAATVAWYASQRGWWERVLSGEYARFFEAQYADRLARGREGSGR